MNDQDHGDGHGHGRHGSGHQENTAEMTVAEKLAKLVDHWIKHNGEHSATYRLWAKRARQERLDEVAQMLEAVADKNEQANESLQKAGQLLQNR